MVNEADLNEYLDEYEDANSRQKLLELLSNRLIEEMEGFDVNTERKKHDLNLLIRDLEEELHFVEQQKLDDFSPEDH